MKMSIRNQRGVGATVVIVAVVVLAVIGIAGWKLTQKNDTPAQKAVQSDCQKLYHDKDLCKFASNADFDKLSYKMTITSTGQNAGTLSMSNDGKGNSEISGDGGGQPYDAITLNNTTYLKDNTDGKWFKFAPSDSSAPKQDDPSSSVKVDNSFTDAAAQANYSYKRLGKEACGKLTCLKYQFLDKTQPGTTQYVWFDTKDYRMQRFQSKDASGTTDMVIVYQAVTISAPSPTKDFSTGVDQQALQQAQAAAAAAAASYNADTSTTDNGQ